MSISRTKQSCWEFFKLNSITSTSCLWNQLTLRWVSISLHTFSLTFHCLLVIGSWYTSKHLEPHCDPRLLRFTHLQLSPRISRYFLNCEVEQGSFEKCNESSILTNRTSTRLLWFDEVRIRHEPHYGVALPRLCLNNSPSWNELWTTSHSSRILERSISTQTAGDPRT